MPETQTPDILGIDQVSQVSPDKEVQIVYLDLAQAILKSQRRTTLVQEWMIQDAQEDEGNKRHLESLTEGALNLLVRKHNQIVNEDRYSSEKRTPIFESQQQVDSVWEKGLIALNPDQARSALREISNEIRSIEVLREFDAHATHQIETALVEKDATKYLLWWSTRRVTNADWVAGSSRYLRGNKEDIVPVEDLIAMVEEDQQKWETEAKAFGRLSNMVNSIPVDPTRARIAMIRMPKEVDPDRRVRLLIDFPPNTFKDNGGMYINADTGRRVFYTGHDAPLCVQDAYYRFYQLMRKETKPGSFEPRAGYLTPYVAVGADEIDGFPEEAKHFIEISFANSDERVPNVQTMIGEQFPGVMYARKDAIDHSDLNRVYTEDDGLAHFIMSRDATGEPIRQDTVQYSLQAVMSGFSNVVNVPVEALL